MPKPDFFNDPQWEDDDSPPIGMDEFDLASHDEELKQRQADRENENR